MSGEPGAPRRLLTLLVLVASAGYICRVAISAVAPQMMADLGLSQTEMGTVFSAFLLGYALLQAPSGWLADRVPTRALFGCLTIAWAVLTAATAGVTGLGAIGVLPLLLGVRALFGVFAAPTYPASARAVGLAFPPAMHGRANGLVLASIGIGSALTPLLVVPIARSHGWRAGLLLPAGIAAVAAALWLWYAPLTDTFRSDLRESSASLRRANCNGQEASPFSTRSFWFLFASYFLQGYVGYIFVFWFYSYLVEVRGFALLQAAAVTALPWVATLIAIPLGGAVSDAAVRRWGVTWGRRSLPLVALLVGAIALAAGARAAGAVFAVAALTACTVLVLCTEGPYWATLNEIAGARSGTAGGVMNFGSNLGGMISPALTPWLAKSLGWAGALTATAALAAVAGVLWLGVTIHQEDPSGGS